VADRRTSQWDKDDLDILGPALLSLTGHGDRLRMHCLLAYVNCKPTKTGVSFTWAGAWEYDQMSGSGRVTLGKDGRLKGSFRLKDRCDRNCSVIPNSSKRRRSPFEAPLAALFALPTPSHEKIRLAVTQNLPSETNLR
jgi:hypothetical protein